MVSLDSDLYLVFVWLFAIATESRQSESAGCKKSEPVGSKFEPVGFKKHD
jgi:hypothetical protein